MRENSRSFERTLYSDLFERESHLEKCVGLLMGRCFRSFFGFFYEIELLEDTSETEDRIFGFLFFLP